MSAYCRWYEKDMENLSEHEQQQCEENGQNCCRCPDLIVKDKKEESEWETS